MIEEGEPPGSHRARGRRPSALRLGARFGYAVGIEVEPSVLYTSAVDFSGAVVHTIQSPLDVSDPIRVEEILVSAVRAAAAACTAEGRGPLLGVGVGIAGLVDARRGIVLYCPGLPGWEAVPLAASLASALSTQVVVDDGVRCMALAEKRHGLARDLDTFLFLYLGRGIGSGIVLDNRIYRGSNGVSGEFGHITVRENGPLCACGNRGCLEAIASTNAIFSRVRELLTANVYSTLGRHGDRVDLPALYAAASAGDKLAAMVIAETEESIGIGVADLINVFDPGTVILAGDVVTNLHALILDGIQRIVRRRAMHPIALRTRILKSSFDANSAARGAAIMVIEQLLGTEILNL